MWLAKNVEIEIAIVVHAAVEFGGLPCGGEWVVIGPDAVARRETWISSACLSRLGAIMWELIDSDLSCLAG
jgi:hypothetical protein